MYTYISIILQSFYKYLINYFISKNNSSVNIDKFDKYIKFDFIKNNEKNSILLPYNKKKYIHLSSFNVYAFYDVNNYVDITQYNGLPYLVSPNMLNAKNIIAVNINDDDYIIEYYNDEIPMFLTK